MYVAWQMQQLLKEKIQPRKSLSRFLLFLIVNVVAVLFITVITGFTIIHFKEFFFTP